MADLKSVLIAALKAYFEVDDVRLRFRPHHFPFTEPSAEIDVGCDRSGGTIKIGAGRRLARNSAAAAWCIRTC